MIIVGASGYLGKALHADAPDIFKSHALGTSSTGAEGLLRLDLNRPDDFDYSVVQPAETVLLTAAISAPDICADQYERAAAVNVTGTSEFITRVIDRGGRVIFFSSDTVYGERGDEFDEHAVCNPAGEYAQMKREVEKRFESEPLFKSIRLSYVFSREDKFTKYLFRCAEQGAEADIFHPFYRAVIHRDDVLEGALVLARRWTEFPQRVINFGGPQVVARTEFAQALRALVLPDLRLRISEPDSEFFRNRPRVIRMTSPLLGELLGRPARSLASVVAIEFNLNRGK